VKSIGVRKRSISWFHLSIAIFAAAMTILALSSLLCLSGTSWASDRNEKAYDNKVTPNVALEIARTVGRQL
jgi:heme/copper-type cytochrome/quinol oxidase subunit 2